jgi:type II secretory pathway predicted ATPase ExeA
MELSRRALEYWGLPVRKECFGNTLHHEDDVFVWPAFEEAVESIVDGIQRRRFMQLVGSPCSAKSTIWAMSKRRLAEGSRRWHCCQPQSAQIGKFNEACILVTVRHTITGADNYARDRETRARQVRKLLEEQNAEGNLVTLAINDAHDASDKFLLLLKRMWDDLYGFDRLLSVMLIGHAGLLTATSKVQEIAERADVIYSPGLGDSLQAYIQHELARCGCTEWMFDGEAIDELSKLSGDPKKNDNWRTRRDHPLLVNNIITSALQEGFRVKERTIGRELMASAIRADKKL